MLGLPQGRWDTSTGRALPLSPSTQLSLQPPQGDCPLVLPAQRGPLEATGLYGQAQTCGACSLSQGLPRNERVCVFLRTLEASRSVVLQP